MPNAVDAKIDEVTQAHVAESEASNISRNVDETARRVKDAIAEFSALEILASGYWEGLYYEAKIMALRAALLELAAKQGKTGTTSVSGAHTSHIDLAAPAIPKNSTRNVGTMTHDLAALSALSHEHVVTTDTEAVAATPKKARKPKAAA